MYLKKTLDKVKLLYGVIENKLKWGTITHSKQCHYIATFESKYIKLAFQHLNLKMVNIDK